MQRLGYINIKGTSEVSSKKIIWGSSLGFFFFPLAVRHVEFGLAPQPGTEPAPPALAGEVLTSGLNMKVPFLFCCLNFKILFVLN